MMNIRFCCCFEQSDPQEIFSAGVLDGSTQTVESSMLTFIAEPSFSCCKNIDAVELESVLSRNAEPEIRTDDTFWVPSAPPPLCKNVENALRTLQSLIEQFCTMRDVEV